MSESASAKPDKPLTPDELVAHQRSRALTIVSVVLLVLAAAVAIQVFVKRQTPPAETSVKLFERVPGAAMPKEEEIARIEISSKVGGDHVKLFKENGVWKLENRFNAKAQQEDVKSLVDNLLEAKVQARPTTEDESRYPLYSATDEFAAYLKVSKAGGDELLHLMVGKGGTTRDFIRFVGANAPKGLFELSDFGANNMSLRDRLKLNTRDEPEAIAWLDLEDFRTLPRDIELKKLTIGWREGEGAAAKDVVIEIHADKGERPQEYTYRVVKPVEGRAVKVAVEGGISALRNLSAVDIAGKVAADGAKLGVTPSTRWVEVGFIDMFNAMTPAKIRYDFGVSKDALVALYVSGERTGEYVYWVSDYVVERLFRPAKDYVDTTVTSLARVQHILIAYKGADRAGPEVTRTKEEAQAKAEELLGKAIGADEATWLKMVDENTSDPGWQHAKYYDIAPNGGFDEAFTTTSLSLRVGDIRVVETGFGFHIIKRIADNWEPK